MVDVNKLANTARVMTLNYSQMLFFAIFLAVAFSSLASTTYAYDRYASVNGSQTFIDTFDMNISTINFNETWTFVYYKDSFTTTDIVLLNYSNNVTFENLTNVTLRWTINVAMLQQNISYEIRYNSTSNVTGIKTLFYEYNGTNVTLQQPSWNRIDIGEFEYRVCSYLLPKDFSKIISVAGSNNSVLNVTTSVAWLKAPANVTIGESLYSIISVNGTIPQINLGAYDNYVYFIGQNFSQNVLFRFTIEDCGLILNYNTYIKECDVFDKASKEYQYCMANAQAKYYQDWLYFYAQQNKTQVVNVTQEVIVEKPVEIIKANETLKDLIDSAEILNQQMEKQRIDAQAREEKIAQLESALRQDQIATQQMIADYPSKINQTASMMFQNAWDRATIAKTWYYWIAGILAFIILSALGIWWYKISVLY